jgi:hypothetical protein
MGSVSPGKAVEIQNRFQADQPPVGSGFENRFFTNPQAADDLAAAKDKT